MKTLTLIKAISGYAIDTTLVDLPIGHKMTEADLARFDASMVKFWIENGYFKETASGKQQQAFDGTVELDAIKSVDLETALLPEQIPDASKASGMAEKTAPAEPVAVTPTKTILDDLPQAQVTPPADQIPVIESEESSQSLLSGNVSEVTPINADVPLTSTPAPEVQPVNTDLKVGEADAASSDAEAVKQAAAFVTEVAPTPAPKTEVKASTKAKVDAKSTPFQK